MTVASESYKGIEFVRISSLNTEEKTLIRQTLRRDKIIKILRDTELLTDCVQFTDYLTWRNDHAETLVADKATSSSLEVRFQEHFASDLQNKKTPAQLAGSPVL